MEPGSSVWPRPLAVALLVLLGALSCGTAAAPAPLTAYVSVRGACAPPGAPPPPGAACMTIADALRNQSVGKIVLTEDIPLQQNGWNHSESNPYALEISRDLEITAVAPQLALNFNFAADAAIIASNRTVELRRMTVENARRGAGLGIDFFVGAGGSRLAMDDVVRWRYVCTAAPDAVKVHASYPRAPGMPGPQRVSIVDAVCWRGTCFEGGSVHYLDFATVVAPSMSESTSYLPGYTLVLRNTTRVCTALVPDACLQVESRDQCLIEYTDRYIDSMNGDARARQRANAIAGGVAGAVGGLALAGAAGAVAVVRRRRKRRRRRRDEEDATKSVIRFGPLDDLVLSNKQHGWKVTHRVHAGVRNGSSGGAPSVDRIELGVLLGAGSFGRVYKGRWQGRDVAVKVMQHDARTASRVANEAHDVITWTHTSASTNNNNTTCGRQAGSLMGSLQQAVGQQPRPAPSEGGAGRSGSLPSVRVRQVQEPSALNTSASPQSLRALSSAATAAAAAALGVQLPVSRAASGNSAGSPAVSGSVVGTSVTPAVAGAGTGLVAPSAGAAPGAAVARSSGSFSRLGGPGGGRVLSFVPVRSLGGGSVAPLLVEEPPGGGGGGGGGDAPQLSGSAAAALASGGVEGAGSPNSAGSGSGLGGSSCDGLDAEAQTWLVVEFCDSGTLADAVRSGKLGPRNSPEMAKVLVRLRDVASGLAYLHSRNVLHGDLKAANVLLCTSTTAPFGMVAKVADFGLSRMLKVGQTHRSTRTVGTVTHMPPELLRLGKLSPAGDVYAFAIIMWELYTGCVAFDRQHYGEVFERVVLRDERPPIPEDMPEAYALLMTRCWQADPMSRPGFDTVLRLINIMVEDLVAQGDGELGLPDGGGGGGSGRAVSGGGRRASGSSAGPREGSSFFQDL
ncbi:kinase [Raphidocelis subcapitata]|uniref:Kinase n=1 Tax=Raphidocelis subcapitata TaxID=307507 RepID=A0A2V0P2Q5_9CHLO|nr:kinase [Raphidocelis subcapitata]|eukprot:GBF92133.1 kinase [Raphidocelis subcapitata]